MELSDDEFLVATFANQKKSLSKAMMSSGKFELGGPGIKCEIVFDHIQKVYDDGGLGRVMKMIACCLYFYRHGKTWLMMLTTSSGVKNEDEMKDAFFELLPKNTEENIVDAQQPANDSKMSRGNNLAHKQVNISCCILTALFALERAANGDAFMNKIATVVDWLKLNSNMSISYSIDHPERSPILIKAKSITKGKTEDEHFNIMCEQMTTFTACIPFFDMDRYHAIVSG